MRRLPIYMVLPIHMVLVFYFLSEKMKLENACLMDFSRKGDEKQKLFLEWPNRNSK